MAVVPALLYLWESRFCCSNRGIVSDFVGFVGFGDEILCPLMVRQPFLLPP
jgi:hypothetical protein